MYIGFSAIIALTFNGPHRIDSRAIPDGQLPHFSEQILLLFFSPTVERNIWVKIRHTILRSLLQLIGIYFDRGCRSDVDYRSHLRPTTFSLSPIQRGMFFNELPLRDCTSFESSDRKNYTVPMGEPTKAADAKGWAQWGRNIAWKNLDSSRPVERISIDSGIKKGSRITINYTWFEKISSRDEFPIFRDRMGNSPRKFNERCPINISSILFQKISFVITLLLLNMNRCVLKKKKKKENVSFIFIINIEIDVRK